MEILVTSELEEYVADKVASGSFASPSDVFAAGLEALRVEEQTMEQWLMDEVVPALEDLEADPSLAVPLDVAFTEIRTDYSASKKVVS